MAEETGTRRADSEGANSEHAEHADREHAEHGDSDRSSTTGTEEAAAAQKVNKRQVLAVRGRKALVKTSNTAARVVLAAASVIAFLIVLGIVFQIFNANPTNPIVSNVLDLDRALVRPFSEMFTPQSAQLKTVVNWGIGAGVYLIVGQVVARVLGR